MLHSTQQAAGEKGANLLISTFRKYFTASVELRADILAQYILKYIDGIH